VGGIKTIRVDVRLVAATNRDLKKEITVGGFREDLYYRLNVVPIALPALRERRGDITHLARHFIAKFNARLKKSVEGIEADALERLNAYQWPGNIRELENVIERALLFADAAKIRLEDLAYELRGASIPDPRPSSPTPTPAAVAASSSADDADEPASSAEGDGLKEQ